MTASALPEGYERVAAGNVDGFAIDEAVTWLSGLLLSGMTVHEWAGSAIGSETLSGRGEVFSVPAPTAGPDGRARWAVRHYQRGGMVASVLDDRYLAAGRPRPHQEMLASVEARARGLPTPTVLAGALYPAGVFYRADLVTELVPDAATLADLLFGDEPVDVAELLEDAGRLTRRLVEARVVHADLNAMNIVVERSTGTQHVIDLDRCAVLPLDGPEMDGGMRERLERSLHKLGDSTGRPLDEGAFRALRDGFGMTS